MSNTFLNDLEAAGAFVEKVAPNLESTIVSDFTGALNALKTAATPVLDASVDAGVAAVTAKFPMNAPFSDAEVAFLEGVGNKLLTMASAAKL